MAEEGAKQRPIRVLIVEDHPIFAEAIEEYLAASGIEIVGKARTKAQAIELAREQDPTIVLMDYHLPDGTGAEAAARVRDVAPGAAVVMLTSEDSEDAMLAAVEAGACGFLSKAESAGVVRDAVQRAARGEMLIAPDVLARLIARRRREHLEAQARQRATSALTPREREVLGMLAQGIDNTAIARRLDVAVVTVRTYVQSIIEKLDAHSKLEAVIRASELGIIGPAAGRVER